MTIDPNKCNISGSKPAAGISSSETSGTIEGRSVASGKGRLTRSRSFNRYRSSSLVSNEASTIKNRGRTFTRTESTKTIPTDALISGEDSFHDSPIRRSSSTSSLDEQIPSVSFAELQVLDSIDKEAETPPARSLKKSPSLKSFGSFLRPRSKSDPESTKSSTVKKKERPRSLSTDGSDKPKRESSLQKTQRGLSSWFGLSRDNKFPLDQPLETMIDVPLIVSACVEKLTQLKAWSYGGIFRKQPQDKDVKKALSEYELRGREVIDSIDDIDLVAVILKRYLRKKIPDSLIPYHLQDRFLSCVEDDGSVSIDHLQLALVDLPEINRKTLMTLMPLLATIASLSEEQTPGKSSPTPGHNFMTAKNLAIVFTPSIMRFPEGTPELDMIGASAVKRKVIVETLVNDYGNLFARKTQFRISGTLRLSDLPSAGEFSCPTLIEDCIKRLIDLKAYEKQGIARIAGSGPSVKKMLERYQEGNREAILTSKSPHDIMSLMKQTLQKTGNWVIPDELKEAFLNLEIGNTNAFKDFINLLPQTRRNILERIMRFFNLIARNHEQSLMNPENCAVCITQNLVNMGISEDTPPAEMLVLMKSVGMKVDAANKRIEFMIAHYHELFLPGLPAPTVIASHSGASSSS